MSIQQMLLGGGLKIINITISADTTNYNLYTAAGSPSIASDVRVTINSGIYVYSTAVATPALNETSSWAVGSKIKITNHGFIMGMGGAGALVNGSIVAGENGGNAISFGIDTTIDNTDGYILGGGGGGAGAYAGSTVLSGGGGGAGGGKGGNSFSTAGGAGGAAGVAGSNGVFDPGVGDSGAAGGGGRIAVGTGGAGSSPGSSLPGRGGQCGGGGGAYWSSISGTEPLGGNGGDNVSAGGNGQGFGDNTNSDGGGGGGGWGQAGGTAQSGEGNSVTAAGSAGKAIALNGHAVTWLGGSTSPRVRGAVS